MRVGYYVNNEYMDETLAEEPPAKPVVEKVRRNILAEKPRVTRFAIKWDSEESAPAEFPPEQPDVDAEADDGVMYGAEEEEEEEEVEVVDGEGKAKADIGGEEADIGGEEADIGGEDADMEGVEANGKEEDEESDAGSEDLEAESEDDEEEELEEEEGEGTGEANGEQADQEMEMDEGAPKENGAAHPVEHQHQADVMVH